MHALLMLLAFHAPAPFGRAIPPAPAIRGGVALMTWHATDCETWFHADSSYSCSWHGRWWHGRWRQAKGVLSVTEWPLDAPASLHRWKVILACPSTGTMSGVPWRLRAMPGRID